MSLLDDPVGWAKTAVGTPTRFAILVVAHLIAAIFSVFGPRLGWFDSVYAGWTGGFLAIYSILYLYALRELLMRLTSKEAPAKEKAGGGTA